jgi:hypothetical protein
MQTLEHTTTIQAPPDAVWRVLTTTDAYGAWNPFITEFVGPLRAGQRVAVTIHAGTKTRTFHPTVVAVEAPTLIRWRGRLGPPGIFDGDHELKLEPTTDGGTSFTQRETFTGVLIPFMNGVLRDTAAGFQAMNEALRLRAESTQPTAMQP